MAAPKEMLVVNNFINGEFEPCIDLIDNVDPATGRIYSKTPNSGSREVERAIEAANTALTTWSNKPATERSKYLIKVADLLEAQLEDFAAAESRDQGKPVWLARSVDVPRAIHNFRHFATTAQCDREMALPQQSAHILHYTTRGPVGVVAIIAPWNMPLYYLSYHLAPALVYGNTVVAKPSEHTPVTSFMLAKLFAEAGVPPGVFNLVFGYGQIVGEALCRHPDTRAIAYTGSTQTGARVSQLAAPYAKKLLLEMGGKNAVIVFSDSDGRKAVTTLLKSCFLNQGQMRYTTSRVFVQRKIYDKFIDTFVAETKKLKVGPPSLDTVFLGPVVSREHLEQVRFYIKLATDEGAKVLCGGLFGQTLELPPENQQGYYMTPTILTDVRENSRCLQEEIYGPVVCVSAFENEQDVVQAVNSVPYGLCASIWSRDVGKIHRLAQKLEVGIVWANCWMMRHLHMPTGGTKMSGVGREGTDASREFYTEVKSICVDYS